MYTKKTIVIAFGSTVLVIVGIFALITLVYGTITLPFGCHATFVYTPLWLITTGLAMGILVPIRVYNEYLYFDEREFDVNRLLFDMLSVPIYSMYPIMQIILGGCGMDLTDQLMLYIWLFIGWIYFIILGIHHIFLFIQRRQNSYTTV